jgi:hypothetical protein
VFLILALFALLPLPALATDEAKLVGAVKAPLVLDEATLNKLPVASVEISYARASGSTKGTYVGVLLWDLLAQAGTVDGAGTNSRLRHTLLVTSRDGYSVAIALGELDPAYGNKKVLLAYKGTDNVPSFAHLRLLVPGDVHAGRAVRDIASIEVR